MNKLPPLIELRAFEAAARHLSFKKAAAELGVTPTAISHQIRLLEQYCGKALFRRKPRPVSLTEAGVRLFPVVRDGLESFVTALGTIRRKDDRQALRITTTNAFAARWLVPRLPHWRKQHPQAPLDITGTDSVLDLLAGDADVAIRYATSRQVPREGIVEEFLSDNYWPVCSPDLLPAGGRLKNAADLRKQVLVHSYWFPSDIEPPSWQRWFSAAKRNWQNLPDFTDMQHLSFREELHAIEAVVSGQGVGMFSDVLVAAELTSGALVKVFNLSLPGYRFYVVRKPGHPREKIIRAFSAWLLSVR
jgi:LysR family transcriptional regulator, glycine cleavage system transcriptional activator